MKILGKQELIEMGMSGSFSYIATNRQLIESIKCLEIGEGIVLEGKEWNYKTNPTTSMFNQYYKSINSPIRIKTKKVGHGKEYFFIRVS